MRYKWRNILKKSVDMLNDNDLYEPDPFEVNRMVCLPGGNVFFMSKKTSDELMEEYGKLEIISIPNSEMLIAFDKYHVVEHNDQKYICGPVVILSDSEPILETDLNREEIMETLEYLKVNETTVPFGWEKVPVFALR